MPRVRELAETETRECVKTRVRSHAHTRHTQHGATQCAKRNIGQPPMGGPLPHTAHTAYRANYPLALLPVPPLLNYLRTKRSSSTTVGGGGAPAGAAAPRGRRGPHRRTGCRREGEPAARAAAARPARASEDHQPRVADGGVGQIEPLEPRQGPSAQGGGERRGASVAHVHIGEITRPGPASRIAPAPSFSASRCTPWALSERYDQRFRSTSNKETTTRYSCLALSLGRA